MRCFVITKKQIMIFAGLVVAVALAAVLSTQVFAASNRKLPIYNVQTDEKKVALSFDAAWGNDDTETLINILAQYNAKATFFVVADWVDKYPESVKQLSDAGHQVQNHSTDHPYMTKLSTEQMLLQLETCNEKIAAITGVTPTLFRAPYGDYNNTVIETVEQYGMYTIQWNIDSRDWKTDATVESITNNVLKNVTPGSIILFHNDAENTPEALPGILESLSAQGYSFEYVSDLIYKDNYTINHAGTQILNSASGSSESTESAQTSSTETETEEETPSE